MDIGDWADMVSLSTYDKGKQSGWNNSFIKDCEAARDANFRAFGRIGKTKGYRPRIVRLLGNHDQGRIDKFVNDNPELEGLVNVDKLGYKDYNCEVSSFREVKIVDGIAYCHFFYDRDSRYPLQTARTVLTKKVHSAVYGHTHIRDFAETVAADGRRVGVTNVGCFLDPDRKGFGYAGLQGVERWWNGLVMLHLLDTKGSYDPKFYGIKEIERKYG